jgi:hypothetical protein
MCPRCKRWVDVDRPWPHWRKLRVLYFGVLGLALMGGPVILADAFVLIPCLMLYMSAIGPLNGLSRKEPICMRCGGIVPAVAG